MKKVVLAVLALGLVTAGLSGCASASAEERAKETGTGFIQAYAAGGEKTVEDFLCEGASSSPRTPYADSKITIEKVVEEGDTWLVVGTFTTATQSETPVFTVVTSKDGGCVQDMKNSRP